MLHADRRRKMVVREREDGLVILLFFCNDTATTEIYTLSLHDALPISARAPAAHLAALSPPGRSVAGPGRDRKSTRLNSSHQIISYAVFCLKKKKKNNYVQTFKKKKKQHSH